MKAIYPIIIFVLCFSFVSCVEECNAPVSVIPYPNHIELGQGYCSLDHGISFEADNGLDEFIYEYFVRENGIVLDEGGVKLLFIDDDTVEGDEGYELNISENEIRVKAKNDTGWFYGLQTLRQLINDKSLPCVDIADAPAYSWRAFMLDEARHFHGKETVKQLLDDMAMLKMNTFHWHLTDDSGWRIEILKYPLLTEIGSKRDSTQIEDRNLDVPGETGDPAYDAFLKRYKSQIYDGKPHSGFYTQSDIREIIEYASARKIKVIPEISMPGHASAAIASYPWLGTSKKEIKVPCNFGVKYQVYDPSSPEVVDFLKDVLKEVSGLFPSEYIHIGGDEVKYDQWQNSASVQEYMKKNGMSNCRELQVKFTNDMCDFIEDELGKKMIGWNEILGINCHVWGEEFENSDLTLSHNAIVQFWTGDRSILEFALKNNYKVIHSFCQDTYLDYSYEQLPLEKAYGFNVVPEGMDGGNIIGLGCQLWTEWIGNKSTLEYQAYPRIAAYAETGWTLPENKSYGRFTSSLEHLIKYWSDKGYSINGQY